MERCGVLIVGAGMAGASAAYELAAQFNVVLVEREAHPGYHTTGRSAALFSETYGNTAIRGLTVGSRAFYMNPPGGFTEHPLLTDRGVMLIARADQMGRARDWAAEASALVPSVRLITAEEAYAKVPVLRPGYVAGAVFEPTAMDIDVHSLHQGYLRGLRARGGRLVTDADVTGLAPDGKGWRVETSAGAWRADVVVNASGAWADVIAALAGLAPVGLVPKRRTALLIDPPDAIAIDRWPATIDMDEQFYFKPDAGKLLMSPADETPFAPCDVQPDELDIAICVDRVQTAADLPVRRINRSWAGLRSFVADKTPVVGFEPGISGFFWLAGQGGYGIQTAPAMGRLTASLVGGNGVPADLAALGVTAAALAPDRFRTS
ncbi:MAG TPA: FAD-dependent oxidoreductase [Stellaceae bacterium]|nr:FAD-dependent oxidoreductase [Stellaceae bacterium]